MGRIFCGAERGIPLRRWISGRRSRAPHFALRPAAKPLRCKTVHRTILRALSRIPSSQQKIRPRMGRIFCGAERGIRTLDTIPGIHDFQSCALDQAQPSLQGIFRTFAILQQFAEKSKIYFRSRKNILKNLLQFYEKRV